MSGLKNKTEDVIKEETKVVEEDSKTQLNLNKKLIVFLLRNKPDDIITKFIETSGVDINYFTNEYNPLFQLISYYRKNEKELYRYLNILIKYKVNINIIWRDGNIPLFELVKFETSASLIKLAKEGGANIYQIDKNGRNLLMYALQVRANVKLIKYLFSLNYNLGHQDNDGNTIYMYATIYYNVNTYNRVLPYLLKNFIYNTNTIITLILMGKNKTPANSNTIFEIIKFNNDIINKKNKEGETALSIAIRSFRQAKFINYLLQLGAHVDDVDKNGSSPLIIAAEVGNYSAFRYLVKYKADLNFKNSNNDTPLIMAAKSNNTDIVNLLLNYREENEIGKKSVLEKKLNPFIQGIYSRFKDDAHSDTHSDGHSDSHLDANSNSRLDVRSDSRLDVRSNSRSDVRSNSLLDVRSESRSDVRSNSCLDVRSNSRLDVRSESRLDGNSDACSYSYSEVNSEVYSDDSLSISSISQSMKILKINERNNDGDSAFTIAIKNENREMVYNLIVNGADTNVLNKKNETPLIIAVKTNNEKIVDLILNLQEEIEELDNYDENHETALMIAIKNKNLNIAKKLLMKNADITIRDQDSNTPLMVASIHSDASDLVKEILNRPNNTINLMDKNGRTALLLAIKEKCADNAKILLENGARILDVDQKKNSSLMIACKRGDIDIANYICTTYDAVDINWQNNSLNTALMKAVKNNHHSLVKNLIMNGAAIEICNKDGNTALLIACIKGRDQIVKTLLEENANIECYNNEYVTPIIAACESNNVTLAKTLIDTYNAKVNYKEPNITERMNNCFISAIENSQYDIVKLLLDNGLLVDTSNKNNVFYKLLSALITAINNSQYKIINEIKDHKQFNEVMKDFRETNVLITACKNIKKRTVDLLLQLDVNVNITDEHGNSALLEACKHPYLYSCIKEMVKRKANLNVVNDEGTSPVLNSCKNDDSKIFKYLIDKNVNIYTTDFDGNNSLMYACSYGDLNKVKYLVKKGINLNAVNSKGETALMCSVKSCNLDIVKYLLKHKADPNIVNGKHQNALVLGFLKIYESEKIVEYKNLGIIKLLIEHGSDPNLPIDEKGNSILMYLIMKDDFSMIKYLLKVSKTVNLNQRNHLGYTAFAYALKCNNFEIIDYFINNKFVDLHSEDDYGNDMIMYSTCGQSGLSIEQYKKMIKSLDDEIIDHRNHNGETYLIMATKVNHERFINILLDRGVQVNLQDSEGNTALHYAAVQGNTKTIKILLNHQAKLEIMNNKNETPLMVACRFEQKDAMAVLIENGALPFFIDNVIYKEKKTFDFKNDQKEYIDLMISHYAAQSEPVQGKYMNTANLIQRVIVFYKPAVIKDKYDKIEDQITDSLEELVEQCIDSITGA